LLFLSSSPGAGLIDPDNPSLGFVKPLTPILIDGEDRGFSHVIAGMDALFHPIEGFIEDNPKAWGLLFLGGVDEGDIDSLAAATYLGDLGAVVHQSLEQGSFEDGYKIEMPDENLEGDVMAVMISNLGWLEEGKQSVADVLRITYNPNLSIYSNRYQAFADELGLKVNNETGLIENRDQYIEDNFTIVSAFGKGLTINKHKESILGGLESADDYARQALNEFLDRLELRLQSELGF
jgi:hypothetical protein